MKRNSSVFQPVNSLISYELSEWNEQKGKRGLWSEHAALNPAL